VADIELVGHAHAAVKLQGLIDDEFSGITDLSISPRTRASTPPARCRPLAAASAAPRRARPGSRNSRPSPRLFGKHALGGLKDREIDIGANVEDAGCAMWPTSGTAKNLQNCFRSEKGAIRFRFNGA
jgi:hypothetical protein